MSDPISTEAPVITYMSSSDISGSTFGASIFQISFDSSLSTLGNVIMFEYKLQASTTDDTIANIEFGFISLEDATIQAGVTNQYILSISAQDNTWDGSSVTNVQIRVYSGHKTNGHQTQDIVVTDWSNELAVYNPPAKPTIAEINVNGTLMPMAYYDPLELGDPDDTLYILLKSSDNEYDFDVVKFIVCYFFKNSSGITEWHVSDPLDAGAVENSIDGHHIITEPNFGKVSLVSGENKVYCSIHAVYNWLDGDGLKYNAVSEMSNEVIADAGSNNLASTVTSTYDDVNQTISVSWTVPPATVLPIYIVDHYTLMYSIDDGVGYSQYGGDSNTYAANATLEQVHDVSLNVCGDAFKYYVTAVYTDGSEVDSDATSVINMFKYAVAVTNLRVESSSLNNGNINLEIRFNGSADTGCGSNPVYVIQIGGSTSYTNSSVTYATVDKSGSLLHNGTDEYIVSYTNINAAKYGQIVVHLQTTDTNSPYGAKAGVESMTYYAVDAFNFTGPILYHMYDTDNRSQTMTIGWTNFTNVIGEPSPWSVSTYTIQKLTNVEGQLVPDIIAIVDGDVFSYDYDVSAIVDEPDKSVILRVVANLLTDTNPVVSFDIMTSSGVSASVFSYPSLVQNLKVVENSTSVTGVNSDLLNISISFDAPLSVGTGTTPLLYVVEFNGVDTHVPSTGSLTYGSDSYTITYSDIDADLAGTISVFLRTTDPNDVPDGRLDGDVSTVYYFASNLVLNDLVYNVYIQNTQTIDMSWSEISIPVGSGWSVERYDVYRYGSDVVDSTTGTSYTYSIPDTTAVNIVMYVVANMVHTASLSTYAITSNTDSVNFFSYADNPTIVLDWAINEGSSNMDIKGSIVPPTNIGVNGGIDSYIVHAYDSDGFSISSDFTILPTDSREFHFDALGYRSAGTIRAYTQVLDTNSESTLLRYYSHSEIGFDTVAVPKFVNDAYNDSSNAITCDIITNEFLGPTATLIYPNGSTLATTTFYTDGSLANPSGLIIVVPTLRTELNNEYRYTVTVTNNSEAVGNALRTGCVIAVSNSAGIGYLRRAFS